jgi:hypothetical protein
MSEETLVGWYWALVILLFLASWVLWMYGGCGGYRGVPLGVLHNILGNIFALAGTHVAAVELNFSRLGGFHAAQSR